MRHAHTRSGSTPMTIFNELSVCRYDNGHRRTEGRQAISHSVSPLCRIETIDFRVRQQYPLCRRDTIGQTNMQGMIRKGWITMQVRKSRVGKHQLLRDQAEGL